MMNARFPSRCKVCHRPIRVGDPIEKLDPDLDHSPWVHFDCAYAEETRNWWNEPPPPPPPQPHVVTWADTMFTELPVGMQAKAYKALSQLLHPDHGGDNTLMQKLNAAYDRYQKGCR